MTAAGPENDQSELEWSEQPEGGALPGGVIQGTVDRITFHAEDTGYTVLKLQVERGCRGVNGELLDVGTRITAVGRAPGPADGMRARLRGEWGTHAQHGLQFQFELLEPLPPLGAEGVAKYLASKTFKGIGPKLAERIVEVLGSDALEIIRTAPERLRSVDGLTRKVREELVAAVQTQLLAHRVNAFLLGLGLGPAQAALVLKKLGPTCETAIREDPYRLARGIRGIGFAIADKAADSLGFEHTNPVRLRAGLLHALERAADDGHSLLDTPPLMERATALLGEDIDADALQKELDELVQRSDVTLETGLRDGARLVYLPRYFTCESELTKNLVHLARPENRSEVKPLAGRDALAEAEKRNGIELHPLQREAVLGLLREPVGLLTGGPGVGKTTIVRLLVELAEWAGARVRLASPTGRAAKRLAEATGRDASTIHRMLGYDPEKQGFRADAKNPIDADLVIVDELSMLDLVLAHHMVKAIAPTTRLALIGDPNQLPAVGAGAVLSDLLSSGTIPTWRLTQIYRQSAKSGIVANAYRILMGETPEFSGSSGAGAETNDFFFFPAEHDRAAATRTVDVVTKRIPQRFGLNWVEDVQVLAPMYRGECGVDLLNERLREALGSGGMEARRGDRIWRTGDRVIHTRNDYDKEVFNGDMGRIAVIHPDGSGLRVRFPDKEVFYEPDEYSDLSPAFAITVHRSQGGEFPAVVMPLVPGHYLMLQRHLLYTAVTRARKLVVLVGSRRALEMALGNAEQRHRESALDDRLRKALTDAKPV